MGLPTAANILLGGAVLYFAPAGEAPPDDSVDVGTAWGGNWARLGYTKAPVTLLYEKEESDIVVEEELSPIDRVVTGESVTVQTVLAEVTSAYLGLLAGTSPVVTAPGAGQVGKDEVSVGGIAKQVARAYGLEGTYRDGLGNSFPVRFFLWKGTITINGEIKFSNRDGDTPGLSIQIKLLADPSQSVGSKLFKLQRVTAAATS